MLLITPAADVTHFLFAAPQHLEPYTALARIDSFGRLRAGVAEGRKVCHEIKTRTWKTPIAPSLPSGLVLVSGAPVPFVQSGARLSA